MLKPGKDITTVAVPGRPVVIFEGKGKRSRWGWSVTGRNAGSTNYS